MHSGIKSKKQILQTTKLLHSTMVFCQKKQNKKKQHNSVSVSLLCLLRTGQLKTGKCNLTWWSTIWVRIWYHQHEPVLCTSCWYYYTGWWSWCNGASPHFLVTLGPLKPIRHHLNALDICCCPCESLHDHNFPSSNNYFQHDNGPFHKAKVISDWYHEQDNEFSVFHWFSPNLNTAEHLWDVSKTGDSQCESAPKKSAEIVGCHHVTVDQNLSEAALL